MEMDLERDLEGMFEGDSKGDFRGDLLSSSGQVWSRSGSIYSPNLILLSLTLKYDDLFVFKLEYKD